MSKICENIINPLRVENQGSDQNERLQKALLPEYAPIDARTEAHDLVFTRNFAQSVIFYNQENIKYGNWKSLFDTDLSVLLAVISLQNPDDTKKLVLFLLEKLKDDDISTFQKQKIFENIFTIVANIAWQMDRLFQKLPLGLPLRVMLENLIDKLFPFYKRLAQYYIAAENRGLLGTPNTSNQIIFGESLEDINIILKNKVFASNFTTNIYAVVSANDEIYGLNSLPKYKQIFLASSHNFFTDIIYRFLQGYTKVIADTKLQFQKSLTESNHTPHIALFLAFTKLYSYTRQHLNTFTAKHLDLYFRKILNLSEKAPQANHVHVLIEPAKHVEKFLLKKNSLLKAGKNENGQDVFYTTDNDIVINHAKVVSLKSLYFSTIQDESNKVPLLTQNLNHRLFVSEENFTKETSYNPFAEKVFENNKLSKINMSEATIGFAIASHYLFLREGDRRITLTINFTNSTSFPSDLKNHFEAKITVDKEWHNLGIESIANTPQSLIFILKLDEKAPSTVQYSEKTHGGQFDATTPLLLINLLHPSGEKYIYEDLYLAYIQNITISVSVQKLKNLYIQTDIGAVDPAKPFMPFGASPKNTSALIIGNDEVFQKNAKFSIVWNLGTDFNYQILEKGLWASEMLVNGKIELENIETIAPNYKENQVYDVSKTEGYLKISYNKSDFEATYNTFLKDMAAFVKDGGTAPTAPVAPVVDLIYLNYDASTDSTFDFFHVLPFGCKEKTSSASTLLPHFSHENATDNYFKLSNSEVSELNIVSGLQSKDIFSGRVFHESEFYIGINQMEVSGVLSLLFQVEDGTADPRLNKPQNHVHWSFLSDLDWVSFNKENIIDATSQLTNTGIIIFTLPKEASTQNPLMPKGNLWIRASISKASGAICRLIKVLPQAVSATLQNPEFHSELLIKPIKANTISKLSDPLAEIKKIEQPFDAFGGRSSELSEKYYVRISERLRHKDRAITIWDYEKLVLENFPSIYKAKCLNHTAYTINDDQSISYHELSAGHVAIITIPNLRNKSIFNPLQPHTSLDLLSKIKYFLSKHTPPFVEIHVQNPIFEQIKVALKVRFFPQFDESFYTVRLQEEITQFLSPWAFDAGQNLVFGGKIEKSAIINFIEERPYVDYMTDVKLYHKYLDINGLETEDEMETINATKGASILVSVPAVEHLIEMDVPTFFEESLTPSCGC